MRNALGMHSRCAGALVAAVAGPTTLEVRAGQLCVTSARQLDCVDTIAARVKSLRRNGLHPRSAARVVFNDILCDDHAIRAYFIKGLLHHPD